METPAGSDSQHTREMGLGPLPASAGPLLVDVLSLTAAGRATLTVVRVLSLRFRWLSCVRARS